MTQIASPQYTTRSEDLGLVSSSRGKRYLYLTAGVLCAGVALGGAFLPLVPTTFPLIIASYCLVRSCPELERRLLRNRVLGRYMKIVDGNEPMPLKAKIISLVMMWVGVGIGAVIIAKSEAPWWLLAVQAVLAVIGTVAICRWGGKRASPVA